MNRPQTRQAMADQLERKLQLYLGSQRDWLIQYRLWLDEHGIPAIEQGAWTPQAHEDHNIKLFVRHQREGRAA